MNQADNCGNCVAFNRVQAGRPMGQCRARAPQVILLGMINPPPEAPPGARPQPVTDSFFPMVPDSQWCGDFSRNLGTVDFSTMRFDGAPALVNGHMVSDEFGEPADGAEPPAPEAAEH